MKSTFLIIFLLFLAFFCGDVAAQFSQPPPNRTAPACDLRKKFPAGEPIVSECKRYVVLASSPSLACVSSVGYIACTTTIFVFVDGKWVEIDSSSAMHDWAYIVDGQEHYINPVYRGWIGFECGRSRQGYVRATVAGSSVVYAYNCSNSGVVEWW